MLDVQVANPTVNLQTESNGFGIGQVHILKTHTGVPHKCLAVRTEAQHTSSAVLFVVAVTVSSSRTAAPVTGDIGGDSFAVITDQLCTLRDRQFRNCTLGYIDLIQPNPFGFTCVYRVSKAELDRCITQIAEAKLCHIIGQLDPLIKCSYILQNINTIGIVVFDLQATDTILNHNAESNGFCQRQIHIAQANSVIPHIMCACCCTHTKYTSSASKGFIAVVVTCGFTAAPVVRNVRRNRFAVVADHSCAFRNFQLFNFFLCLSGFHECFSGEIIAIQSLQQVLKGFTTIAVVHTGNVIHRAIADRKAAAFVRNSQYHGLIDILRIDTGHIYIVQIVLFVCLISISIGSKGIACYTIGSSEIVTNCQLAGKQHRAAVKLDTIYTAFYGYCFCFGGHSSRGNCFVLCQAACFIIKVGLCLCTVVQHFLYESLSCAAVVTVQNMLCIGKNGIVLGGNLKLSHSNRHSNGIGHLCCGNIHAH